VYRTARQHVAGLIDITVTHSWLESFAISTLVDSGTTAWNRIAGFGGLAPHEVILADTLSGLTIVIDWAIAGDVITGRRESTPACFRDKCQTSSASVMSSTTTGNVNTLLTCFTPRLVGERTQAESSDAVVAGRTKRGNVVALVADIAPGSVGLEGQASSAVVMGQAARGHLHAAQFLLAPGKPCITDAFTGFAIVVVWTTNGDVVASVCLCTPSGTVFEAQAVAAIIGNETTAGNSDACILSCAPSLANWTEALTGGAIMKNLAQFWNIVTAISGHTPCSSGLEGQAIGARVPGFATRGNLLALFSGITPGISVSAQALSSGTIVTGGTQTWNFIARVGHRAPRSSS